jgi:hypothetical protein
MKISAHVLSMVLTATTASAATPDQFNTQHVAVLAAIPQVYANSAGMGPATAALTTCLKGLTVEEKAGRLAKIVELWREKTSISRLSVYGTAAGILACKTKDRAPEQVVEEFEKNYQSRSELANHRVFPMAGWSNLSNLDFNITSAAMMVEE